MAKEDLFLLFEKRKEYDYKIKKLNEIIDICDNDILIKDYDFYSISSKAKLIADVLNIEMQELTKHSMCNHDHIKKDLWIGNDSHYDYYVDQCDSCEKIIKKNKI
jgi:hypothetical protein